MTQSSSRSLFTYNTKFFILIRQLYLFETSKRENLFYNAGIKYNFLYLKSISKISFCEEKYYYYLKMCGDINL